MAWFKTKSKQNLDRSTASSCLKQVLALSISLNLALIATFIYQALNKDEEKKLAYEPKQTKLKESEEKNSQVAHVFRNLSFDKLLEQLSNKEPLEDGYSYRDLALGALVSFHQFNLEGALQAKPKQQRWIYIDDPKTQQREAMEIFPALEDSDFEAALRFANEEKWPLSSKGLFKKLKYTDDNSLMHTFFLSSEFQSIYQLFHKAKPDISKESVLELVLEGDWGSLLKFELEQKKRHDFSKHKRLEVLFSYIDAGSQEALALFLELEDPQDAKKMTDEQVSKLLAYIPQKGKKHLAFIREILSSLRKDEILDEAAIATFKSLNQEISEKDLQLNAKMLLEKAQRGDDSRHESQEVRENKLFANPSIPKHFALEKLQENKALSVQAVRDAKDTKAEYSSSIPATSIKRESQKEEFKKVEYARGERRERKDIKRIEEVKKPVKIAAVKAAPPAKSPQVVSAVKQYVVQKGDNLWKIAKEQGVSISTIKAANELESDAIQVGKRLYIPQEN